MKTSFKKEIIANKFEAYNDILERTLGFRFVFQTFLSNPKITSVLDYGCGPGKVSHRLAKKTGINVFAVDESKEMINIATKKRHHPNINYHLIKNNHLSFLEDNSVGGAMACYVFINTEKKEQILKIMKEIYRVLRPGSLFVILDTNPDSTGIEFSTFQNGVKGKKYMSGEARQEWLHIKDEEDLILHDFHWPKSVYEELLTEAGFQEIDILEPTLKDIPCEELKMIQEKQPDHHWKNEWEFPPFAIYKSIKPIE
ncbi:MULTISPECIES: class I SAM-dependent methyltransferase [Clostridia]|uniref:class I SAM-dependent methyltransferase n=1 Tax=Clostridia TaxID=186801 RepID=UPI000EA05778|nr:MULTISPECIES: class I SAM-dependent methyltransferase [Clostridia]NBJ70715.1 class I SAM-dependent methyltransferase [Roseburia sp. 1XD42-34]RKI76829.1 class I SAM-dependent methyltransferase [Clostridium sp. 1xD42-85]